MEVLEIRPARVSAALVAIGDMLVVSPIGPDGPRPSQWIGAVTEHIIVEKVDGKKVRPADWRQWRIGMVSGESKESAVVPADGWVWVHLPIVDSPAAPTRTQPTVNGIRGHRITSPEEDEARRQAMLSMPPITPEHARRLIEGLDQ
jgi:hypothetical protein